MMAFTCFLLLKNVSGNSMVAVATIHHNHKARACNRSRKWGRRCGTDQTPHPLTNMHGVSPSVSLSFSNNTTNRKRVATFPKWGQVWEGTQGANIECKILFQHYLLISNFDLFYKYKFGMRSGHYEILILCYVKNQPVVLLSTELAYEKKRKKVFIY